MHLPRPREKQPRPQSQANPITMQYLYGYIGILLIAIRTAVSDWPCPMTTLMMHSTSFHGLRYDCSYDHRHSKGPGNMVYWLMMHPGCIMKLHEMQ